MLLYKGKGAENWTDNFISSWVSWHSTNLNELTRGHNGGDMIVEQSSRSHLGRLP